MRTPAGQQCRFYYQNFHRGRSDQECRLVKNNAVSAKWKAGDCAGCPVPQILRANSSPDLVLEGSIRKGLLGLGRAMTLKAYCTKHLVDVASPEAGCPQCAAEKPGLSDIFDPTQ